MAKLTPKYDIRVDGSKNIKGYSLSIKKSDAEILNWNKDTQLDITVEKNKIIIEKGELE